TPDRGRSTGTTAWARGRARPSRPFRRHRAARGDPGAGPTDQPAAAERPCLRSGRHRPAADPVPVPDPRTGTGYRVGYRSRAPGPGAGTGCRDRVPGSERTGSGAPAGRMSGMSALVEPVTALPPRPVGRTVFTQEWTQLTFLHW